MGKGYYVGLDMGTGSVGWAVTDESYQILRRHGKAMWGVRLFESAKTAEERRMFRTGRRRLDRRGWRIEILQEIFAEEISRVDPGFFLRMKESKYYPEDKRDIQGNCPELPYTLFVDKTFTDKDFHKKYPTIYHLRKMLMETEDTPDIRLVYLALHHMMKHRGHFLLSGDISQVTEFKNTFNQFIENIRNEGMDFEIELDESAVQMIEETLKDKNLTRSAKKAKLVKGLNAKNVRDKAFLTLLSGGTVKLSDLFGMEELNEGERPKISFADNRYEEYAAVVEMELGELYYIVESAKAVYDWAILSDILGGSTSVSDAKVRAYEKHKADLKYLKAVVKEYFPKEVYNAVFVESSDKLNNYPAYIGMTKKNGKKVSLEGKRCSREEFMDFLKKNIVVKLPDEETKMYLQSELEKDSFLPKQVNKDNGVIPYQVHKYELKKILDNLGDKIPFLKENAEKIEKLFSFRIPYYVGPLRTGNGENSKFAWAERKSTEKIYPWNFENVIDVEQSAENFIRRMTNKCTYLIGEDVLPKDSLLYSKFMVLNELNNLRLDGQKISVELKQKIYRDVFCRSRKVTQKKLKSYLIREGIAGKNVELTGIDGDFKGSLTAYHDFKEKLTGVELTQKEKEEIILNIVLFGDDKKLLKQRLKKKFPQLTEKQINTVTALSYKGWGRLSKKLLEEVTVPAPETGEVWNIITALWETNDNFMQLLGKEYQFSDRIEEFNEEKADPEVSYQTIEDLYVSPAVKRQIWQTLQIVQELYEKKLVTYPRTDARVLSSAVAREISKNLRGLQQYGICSGLANEILQGESWKKIGSTRYTNDKQITDHYAIIPTGQGLNNLRNLSELSAKVYETIVRRFLGIFYPPAVYQKVALVTEIGGEQFFSNFRVLVQEGYLKAMQYSFFRKKEEDDEGRKEDETTCDPSFLAALSQLQKGSELNLLGLSIKEGETSPPKRYTSGSMILAMENAGQLIEDEELREQIKGSGIGTSATRAEILKKLVFIKYLALNKKTQVITPTQLGEMIYDVVHQSIRPLLNPELTASWEKGLTYVAEGSITSEEYMGKLENFVTRHTVNVKQMRNQFQLKSSFDASAPYYRKASSTRSRTGKRTAAEDSSAKSYSTARKKGAQNS